MSAMRAGDHLVVVGCGHLCIVGVVNVVEAARMLPLLVLVVHVEVVGSVGQGWQL